MKKYMYMHRPARQELPSEFAGSKSAETEIRMVQGDITTVSDDEINRALRDGLV